jgi:hypothetical protein
MRNQNHFDASKFNTQNEMATKTGRRMRSTHAANRIDKPWAQPYCGKSPGDREQETVAVNENLTVATNRKRTGITGAGTEHSSRLCHREKSTKNAAWLWFPGGQDRAQSRKKINTGNECEQKPALDRLVSREKRWRREEKILSRRCWAGNTNRWHRQEPNRADENCWWRWETGSSKGKMRREKDRSKAAVTDEKRLEKSLRDPGPAHGTESRNEEHIRSAKAQRENNGYKWDEKIGFLLRINTITTDPWCHRPPSHLIIKLEICSWLTPDLGNIKWN